MRGVGGDVNGGLANCCFCSLSCYGGEPETMMEEARVDGPAVPFTLDGLGPSK